MDTVFVSYSHKDSAFADRLVRDLQRSQIPATYDRWILNVGDSIITKISEAVTSARGIIALISPSSVSSNWVGKELAIAMSDEINSGRVRVLPALLADCQMPPALSDKLYADFRSSYYRGLGQIVQALRPESYNAHVYVDQETVEAASKELRHLLDDGSKAAIVDWFSANLYAIGTMLGHLWMISEIIPNLQVGGERVEFVCINGQSSRYYVSFILLGPPSLVDDSPNDLEAQIERAKGLLDWGRANKYELRHLLATHLSPEVADRIWPGSSDRSSIRLDARILCGRREQFDRAENERRNAIYDESSHGIDIASYDRLFDSIPNAIRGGENRPR